MYYVRTFYVRRLSITTGGLKLARIKWRMILLYDTSWNVRMLIWIWTLAVFFHQPLLYLQYRTNYCCYVLLYVPVVVRYLLQHKQQLADMQICCCCEIRLTFSKKGYTYRSLELIQKTFRIYLYGKGARRKKILREGGLGFIWWAFFIRKNNERRAWRDMNLKCCAKIERWQQIIIHKYFPLYSLMTDSIL